jgi:uncharacterized protein YeaO (DUF488 family)
MPAIRTACYETSIDREYDGFRILVTRYIPRGCRRTRFDAWMANLGPSERLLKGFQAGRIPWDDFAKRYEEELFETAPVDRHNPRIKNKGQKFTLRLLKRLARKQPITLLCNCGEDEEHCHRHLLKALIESKKV